MRASGIGDSFFRSTVDRRMTVASRKEIWEALPIGLAMLDGITALWEDESESWSREGVRDDGG